MDDGQPQEYVEYAWSPRHGDTEQTPPVAVLRRDGTVDLASWTVRAQVRERGGNLVHVFAPGVGILLGEAEVTIGDRDPVTTSTARLRLRPEDWSAIPRRLRGASYDVELTSPSGFVRTVFGGTFEPVEDVSHDD